MHCLLFVVRCVMFVVCWLLIVGVLVILPASVLCDARWLFVVLCCVLFVVLIVVCCVL